MRIEEVTLRDRQGRTAEVFASGEPLAIEIGYTVVEAVPDPVFEVTIEDAHGEHLGGLTSRLDGIKIDTGVKRGVVRLVLDPLVLVKGDYAINVHIRDQHIQRYHDFRKRAAVLVVEGLSVASREISGYVNYPHRWELS
jgi:hypothetical protein